MGSKKRIANDLYKVMRAVEMHKYGEKTKLPYFEPFVGMFNVVKEFDDGRKRIVCDLNADIIKLWQQVLYNDWKPPKLNMSVNDYKRLQKLTKPSAERGFYGCVCAFGGQYMSSFAGNAGADVKHKIKTGYNNVLKYKQRLHNTKILNSASYESFNPRGMLIYCDPPYARTVGKPRGKYLKAFDSEIFWNTMRKWSKHNLVFVSEEKAPPDFVAIWKKQLHRTAGATKTLNSKKCMDKLFIHETNL